MPASHSSMDSTERWARLARHTGAAGMVGAVLLFTPVISVSSLGEPPLHADEQEVVAFFDATAEAGWFEAGETVFLVGALVLLWSLVGLGLLLRRAEGPPAWRSAMVVVSAGLFAAYAIIDVSWDVAGRHGSDFDSGLAHYAYDTGNLGFANTWLALGSLAAASGWVTLETRVLPRWTGWLALFAAAGFVVARFVWTTNVWLVPYAAFWIWFLAVCIRLLRKPDSLIAAT